MPDIYATAQMFTCYDKYAQDLITLSKCDFSGNCTDARISQTDTGIVGLTATEDDLEGVDTLTPAGIVWQR